jgi:hypothetical protein
MMRIIGSGHSYDEFVAVLRMRAHELGMAHEHLDHAAPFQTGYAGKIFAGVPMKSLGRFTFGPMLRALGLKFVLVEDADAIKRITYGAKKRNDAGESMPAKKKPRNRRSKNNRHLRGISEWGKLFNAKRSLKLSPMQRIAIARRAAIVRWATIKRAAESKLGGTK